MSPPERRLRPASGEKDRSPPELALLDAAERLLIEVGHAAISTRRLAREAGVNHGLIHYYFGSMANLFLQVLERFTGRLVARQRRMYGAEKPFLEKWRTAMRFIEEDLEAGYPKILLELNAMAWNEPALREQLFEVNARWRGVLTDAFREAHREYGLDEAEIPVEAMVSLVMTFNQGLFLERMSGVREGHEALLAWIDGWLASLEERAGRTPP